MKLVHQLVSRPQYMMVERGTDVQSFTELVVIVNAARVEETNEHRLALAARMLAHAIQMLEFEINLEHHDRAHSADIPAPQIKGGYN